MSKKIKIILGLIVLVFVTAAIFKYRSQLLSPNNDNYISGKWIAIQGTILDDKQVTITFEENDDLIIGKNSDKSVVIKLISSGNKTYDGFVITKGEEQDYLVHNLEDKNKLVFFSTLTKTSWNMKKVND